MAIVVRAALAAALLVWLVPHAQAQMLPRGSYLRTCPEASVYRGRLTAVCRRRDGSFQQFSLADVGPEADSVDEDCKDVEDNRQGFLRTQ